MLPKMAVHWHSGPTTANHARTDTQRVASFTTPNSTNAPTHTSLDRYRHAREVSRKRSSHSTGALRSSSRCKSVSATW
eukprot:250396-Prorocentrum_minimum.AAC.4